MIKQKWQAEDELLFDSEKAAEEYELTLHLANEFIALFNGPGGYDGPDYETKEFIHTLFQRKDQKLKTIFQKLFS